MYVLDSIVKYTLPFLSKKENNAKVTYRLFYIEWSTREYKNNIKDICLQSMQMIILERGEDSGTRDQSMLRYGTYTNSNV